MSIEYHNGACSTFRCSYPHRHPAPAVFIVKLPRGRAHDHVCGYHLPMAVQFVAGFSTAPRLVPVSVEVCG